MSSPLTHPSNCNVIYLQKALSYLLLSTYLFANSLKLKKCRENNIPKEDKALATMKYCCSRSLLATLNKIAVQHFGTLQLLSLRKDESLVAKTSIICLFAEGPKSQRTQHSTSKT